MSADELHAINAMLRESRLRERPTGWPAQRAAMEASTAVLPQAAGVTLTPVTANGVPAEWQARPDAAGDAAILYLHGGGYAIGSIATHRALTTALAAAFEGRVLSLDYRLAPEHPCPAAIEDAVVAYRFLLDQGLKPGRIVIAGDSAGGGLTVATLLALREAGLPSPAGGWCISPWVDLTNASGTMSSKADEDLIVSAASLDAYAAAYAAGGDLRAAPCSPLFGDLAGLPPLLIQVGSAETLLDDSLGLAANASRADVEVRLEVWPGQQHVFHMFAPMLGEARAAIAAGAGWVSDRIA